MRKTYRLADKIRVTVVRVDLDEKKIDLELA
jgi:ribonuclease R